MMKRNVSLTSRERQRRLSPKSWLRIKGINILDLRVILAGMCLMSFLLTFLYLDDFEAAADRAEERMASDELDRVALDDSVDSVQVKDQLDRPRIPAMSKEEEELLRDEEDEGVMEPEVLTIQPFHGPPTGGVLVTIHGHNLRSSHGYGNPTAFVGGVTCNETTVIEQDELTCITPPGIGGRLSVRVVLRLMDPEERGLDGKKLPSSLRSKDNTLFSYDEPTVDVVVPEHGRTSGGTLVTVHGSNFGPVEAEGQVVVLVAGVPCAQTTRVSDKVALCLTPPGIPGVKGVVVAVGADEQRVESQRAFAFAYVMTPAERLSSEAETLLDGLTVKPKAGTMHVVMHQGAVGNMEVSHKDLFTGATATYCVPPDLLAVLPKLDLRAGEFGSCAVVGNSGSLLERDHGARIDAADRVFRFNNAPTSGFENHVGRRTDFRLVETRFARSMLSRDPADRKRGWRPSQTQTLLLWSEFAQDLYVQIARVFQRLSIFYVSRELVDNSRTVYRELRERFEDLGVSTSWKPNSKPDLATQRNASSATSGRRLQQSVRAGFSLQRMAEMERLDNKLDNVEPHTGPQEPPPEFMAATIALQLCDQVDLYGFEPFVSTSSEGNQEPGQTPAVIGDVQRTNSTEERTVIHKGPYYIREGLDGVYGINEDNVLDEDTKQINTAILELLRIRNYIHVHN